MSSLNAVTAANPSASSFSGASFSAASNFASAGLNFWVRYSDFPCSINWATEGAGFVCATTVKQRDWMNRFAAAMRDIIASEISRLNRIIQSFFQTLADLLLIPAGSRFDGLFVERQQSSIAHQDAAVNDGVGDVGSLRGVHEMRTEIIHRRQVNSAQVNQDQVGPFAGLQRTDLLF